MGHEGNAEMEASRYMNGTREVIVDEVLCFLSSKIDCVPTDVLLLLCNDAFDDADVEKAKRILFISRPPKPPSKLRFSVRQEPNKKNKNLKDIIQLLAELGEDIPVFVARDLMKLPPIRMENIDVSNLLHRLDSLSTEVSSMKSAVDTVQSLTAEVATLKATVERLQLQGKVRDHPLMQQMPQRRNSNVSKKTNSAALKTAPATMGPPNIPALTGETSDSTGPPPGPERPHSNGLPAAENQLSYAGAAATGGWMIAGRKPKKYTRRTGTADSSKITVIKNMKLLTMFGSRFGPNITTDDILEHFKGKGLNVICEPLQARYPQKYASFKVSLRAENPFPLLKEENWPKGCYFRRFREARNTKHANKDNELGDIDSVSGDNV